MKATGGPGASPRPVVNRPVPLQRHYFARELFLDEQSDRGPSLEGSDEYVDGEMDRRSTHSLMVDGEASRNGMRSGRNASIENWTNAERVERVEKTLLD